jgi:hypothetical protein
MASTPWLLQRGQHAGAGHQRHLALGAAAAHQHGDLAQGLASVAVHWHLQQLLHHLGRHRADRAGAHGDDHVAGAGLACDGSGSAATSSTNTGSTLPATRRRAPAPAVGATMGASPAA